MYQHKNKAGITSWIFSLTDSRSHPGVQDLKRMSKPTFKKISQTPIPLPYIWGVLYGDVGWGGSDMGYLSPNYLLFQCSSSDPFLNSLISQPLAGIHFPPFHVNPNVNLFNQFSQYSIYVR